MPLPNAVSMAADPNSNRIYVLDTVGPRIWIIDTTDPEGGTEPLLLGVNGVIGIYYPTVPSTILPQIQFEPGGRKLWLADGASNTAYTIDPVALTTTPVAVAGFVETSNSPYVDSGNIVSFAVAGNTYIEFAVDTGTTYEANGLVGVCNIEISGTGGFGGEYPAPQYVYPYYYWTSVTYMTNQYNQQEPGGYFVDNNGNGGFFVLQTFDTFLLSSYFTSPYTTPSPVGAFDISVTFGNLYAPDGTSNTVINYGSPYGPSTSVEIPIPAGGVLGSNVVDFYSANDQLFVFDSAHNALLYYNNPGSSSFQTATTVSHTVFELLQDNNGGYPSDDQFGIWGLSSGILYRFSIPMAGVTGPQNVIEVPLILPSYDFYFSPNPISIGEGPLGGVGAFNIVTTVPQSPDTIESFSIFSGAWPGAVLNVVGLPAIAGTTFAATISVPPGTTYGNYSVVIQGEGHSAGAVNHTLDIYIYFQDAEIVYDPVIWFEARNFTQPPPPHGFPAEIVGNAACATGGTGLPSGPTTPSSPGTLPLLASAKQMSPGMMKR